jgi:hypothetical protein
VTTNVRVTYSDGSVADNVLDAATAVEVFAAYQRECDHPRAAAAARGADAVLPIEVMFTNE